MTTEEQRLSEWLHEQTPQPPPSIDLAVLADRSRADDLLTVSAARSRLRWVAVLAGAAAIAVLAGLLATLPGRGQHSTPATPSPTPTTTTTQRRSTPTPTPTSTPEALIFRPWKARLIAGGEYGRDLAAIGSSLYSFGGDSDVERIDPRTGAVQARHREPTASSSTIVAAAGRVWTLAPTGAHAVILTGHDPLSLRALVHYRFTVSGQGIDGPALAAGGDTLYVGQGSDVLLVNASTGRLTSSFTVSDGVDSVSASPDGSRVVVATTGPDGKGVIEELDATSGHELLSRVAYGCGAVQAVERGYYATCGQGMEDQVSFQPFDGSPVPGSGPGVRGGGGIPAVADVSGGIVWLGGPQEAACVDPRTQRVRAHVALHSSTGDVGGALVGLSVVAGRLYASYVGLNNNSVNGLVELTPPQACGLR